MLKTDDILTYPDANKSHFKEKYFVDRIALVGLFPRGDNNNDSDIDIIVYFLPEAKNQRIFRIYLSLQDNISSYFTKMLI